MKKFVKKFSESVKKGYNYCQENSIFLVLFFLFLVLGLIGLIAGMIASGTASKKIYVTAFILISTGFIGVAKFCFVSLKDEWREISFWNKCRRIAGGIIYASFVFLFSIGAINYFKEIPSLIKFAGYVFVAIVFSAAFFLAVSLLQFIVFVIKGLIDRFMMPRKFFCAINSVMDDVSSENEKK